MWLFLANVRGPSADPFNTYVVPALLMLGGWIIVTIWTHFSYRAQITSWTQFAENIGLELESMGRWIPIRPWIIGTTEGIDLTCRVESRGGRKGSRNYTVMRASLPPGIPGGLTIRAREKVPRRVVLLLEDPHITVGHPELDRELHITGSSAVQVRRFFENEVVVKAVRRIFNTRSGVYINRDQIVLTRWGAVSSVATLTLMFKQIKETRDGLQGIAQKKPTAPG